MSPLDAVIWVTSDPGTAPYMPSGDNASRGAQEISRSSESRGSRCVPRFSFGPFLRHSGSGTSTRLTVFLEGCSVLASVCPAVSMARRAGATVVSSSEITTTVPADAATGEFEVVTPGSPLSSNVSLYCRRKRIRMRQVCKLNYKLSTTL
jgi:hypothetical protein